MQPIALWPRLGEVTAAVVNLYLDLIERCLTRSQFGPPYELAGPPPGTLRGTAFRLVRRLLPQGLEIVRRGTIEAREQGHVWPADAETMIGLARLRNIRECVVRVLEAGVPGDLLEAGVWRGGTAIYMRAILKAYGVTDRSVWVADSFRGLPKPRDPRDTIDWSGFTQLAVPLEEVRQNFARYGLLDEQVRFVEGFFVDSLPTAPVERLAVLRIDADMYESTMDVLNALYRKVQRGGFVIVDEYVSVDPCRRAVDEYRARHAIAEPITPVDDSAAYWRVAE